MERATGWAEPDCIIGQPRLQKVDGFHYLYVEQQHVAESEVGVYIGSLFGKIHDAYEKGYGAAEKPPILVMFFDLPDEPRVYDMQVGFSVPEGTSPLGEAQVRYVEPSLCASVLVWGNLDSVISSYGPLLEFMDTKDLKCIEGWREWYLYWEGDSSSNNITWVQHVAQEA